MNYVGGYLQAQRKAKARQAIAAAPPAGQYFYLSRAAIGAGSIAESAAEGLLWLNFSVLRDG